MILIKNPIEKTMNCKTTIVLLATLLAFTNAASDFEKNIKIAAKTLGGINCMIDAVFSVENAALDYSSEIDLCNVEPSAEVSQIVSNSESITKKTDNVINIDNGICQNTAYNEKTDAKKAASSLCINSMTNAMNKLYKVVDSTKNYISNNESNISDSCLKIATTQFKTELPMFEELVKNCAKLYKK